MPFRSAALARKLAKIVDFDAVPGSNFTNPIAINAAGQITGSYRPAGNSGGGHGFLRQVDGTIVTFNVPNSTHTVPTGISSAGCIAGFFGDGTHDVGFLRAPGGGFITFEVPNSGYTQPTAIN